MSDAWSVLKWRPLRTSYMRLLRSGMTSERNVALFAPPSAGFVVIPPSSINSLSCRVEIGTHRSSDIDMHMHTPQTGRAWSRETVGLLGFSLYKFSGGSRHSCPSYRILETFLVTYLCIKALDYHCQVGSQWIGGYHREKWPLSIIDFNKRLNECCK